MDERAIEKAAQLIANSHYAVALTGAGISTPSGLPDFRSPESGLWSKVDPMEVASIHAFRRDPKTFYQWYAPRGEAFLEAEPNPAHRALAHLEEMGLLKATITQNIDNLHQRAGSQRVIELHGNAREALCLACGNRVPSEPLWQRFKEEGEVPLCERCGGYMKPNVILFGELLPTDALSAAWEEAERCDLMLVVGSSLLITPAADLPFMARRRGAKLIIVNYQPTPADGEATVVIREDVAEVLPKIVKSCKGKGAQAS